MLIDRIYRKVKTYLNTEGRGNIKPERFNLLTHDAIQERQGELIFELNRLINRENRGFGGSHLENLPQIMREKLSHYLDEEEVSVIVGETFKYKLPLNAVFIDEVNDAEEDVSFEFCKNKRTFNINKSQATASYPLYFLQNDTLRTSHSLGQLNIAFLRTPNKPKWTYTIFEGNELFNPSANDFMDADIHISEEDEIVKKILLSCGVTLKENDIVAFASQDESKAFNQNNAN